MTGGRKLLKVLLLAVLAVALVSFSPVSTRLQQGHNLAEKLDNHYRKYPQQKVYVHLDKLAYRAGETLWYKAILLDARSHLPDTIGKNLVVELVNTFGESSLIQMSKIERGFAHGDLVLPEKLPQGLYRLRAYTNWMRNFGEEYFFSREINIWNPEEESRLYRDDKLANKRMKKKSQRKAGSMDVQFFPEGGDLVGGLASRVGFKGINELGLSVHIDGEVLDKSRNSVASFESTHLGMGVFTLTPEQGMKYTAVIMDENGKSMKFPLPEILAEGYVLSIAGQDKSSLSVNIQSTYPDGPVFLSAHTRGNLIHHGAYSLLNGEASVELPIEDNPGGIMSVTLFNARWEPVCERLLFIPNEDILNIFIEQDKAEYGSREKVNLVLTARDARGTPVEGEFSLAVSDRDLENHAGDYQSGIIPSVFLTSDIAGRIENPTFYFRQNDAKTREAMDILLLTQGWRRFAWKDVIDEERMEIDYPIQRGLAIHGYITAELLNRPLKNTPVTLTVLSEFNDRFISKTDDDGRYFFNIPDYEDTITVEITARRQNGRKNLVIHLDDNDLPGTEAIYSSYSRDMVIQGGKEFKPIPEEEPDTMQVRTEGIYSQPDYVLYVDDNMRSYSSVLQMIQGRIPGVNVSGNDVNIRGPSSILLSSQPLFLLDNVPVDIGVIRTLSPYDVERIEVLKGPSAAIYGVRGGNGVIAIFTRRGRFLIKGRLEFEMLGYHKPREFYVPRYGTGFDNLMEDNRSCLYWNPKVRTDSDGRAEVSFYNSEKTGRFYIVTEGISGSGQLGSTERSFIVE